MKPNRKELSARGGTALAWMVLAILVCQDTAPARAGQWLQLRGDRQMSGRATGVGNMGASGPVEAWRFDIAAWEGFIVVHSGREPRRIDLPFPDQVRALTDDGGAAIVVDTVGGRLMDAGVRALGPGGHEVGPGL